MKRLLSSRGLFAFAFIVLVATNIVVLSGVASNRSGEPGTLITLTERELQLPYKIHKENSGLSLRLAWRALDKTEDYSSYPDWRSPGWFNAEKLKELGFNLNDFHDPDEDRTLYRQPIPKEVFIVLENDGEPYREAVRRAKAALEKEEKAFTLNPDDKKLRNNFERAKNQLQRELTESSRLFAVDAGLDADELRKKYSDRSRFIITRGLVKPRVTLHNNKKHVFGYISRLSVASIHVPLEYRQIFDSILITRGRRGDRDGKKGPRFEVTLAYGKRFEPWIVAVAKYLHDKREIRQ